MLSNQFKFQYSVGAIANGIKTDMFTFFLLFFYSRVIGLEPLLASLAIGAALIVDSITDPLMGTISDRTNTKLGRRHPYMIVSFIPVSIFYILLFTPKPDWDITQNQLFWWMFVCASFTRIGMTLFEVPHRSFGAEITKDWFKDSFVNEKVFNENGDLVGITVLKGNNDPNNTDKDDHEVDAISGSTITGDGVTDMIIERLNNYLPYLKKLNIAQL